MFWETPIVPFVDLHSPVDVSCQVPLYIIVGSGCSVHVEQSGPAFQQSEYAGTAPVAESPYVSSMVRISPETYDMKRKATSRIH